MARAKKREKSDPTAALPAWAQKLAERYYTRTVNTFLLHGAVRDLMPLTGDGGARSYGPLRSFLAEELFGGRDHVIFYDRSSGIRAATPESQKDLLRSVAAYDSVYGTELAKSLPRDPGRALQVIENHLRVRLSDGQSLAVVIDFAETLVPSGEMAHLSAEDRFVLATLLRWSHDPQFLSGDVSVVLVAENLADISPKLSRNPYVSSIDIPLPNEEERREYVETKLEGAKIQSVSDLSAQALSRLTSGLSRLNLDRLLTEALERGVRVTPDVLKERKKEIIQAECHGLLEFIEPAHTLDSVAGHPRAKALLKRSADALKQGRLEVLPMGYLVCGPVGTGKTFMVNCFAGEIGIPCVKFLNFRSQWQGVTEANLEKIFTLLKALHPVAVMIDEADAFLGDRDAGGDSGTSNRVFASIAAFMGNTEYRGKILWFLLTCRPDLLPVDLKRQGRAEEHLALFYPQTDAELDELFRVLARKTKVDVSISSFASLLPADQKGLSGADMEAILVRAKFRAAAEGHRAVSEQDLVAVVRDFVPPSYPEDIELQNLVAVQECTSRELIPEAFRDLGRHEVTERIRALKVALGDAS